MRYLNKIVFLNSAHIPLAEIELDGNVHFIGTQGVGKSTLLRAILFFYNADKMKLGIAREKSGFETYYFPHSNSYIVYEVMREEGAYCILASRQQSKIIFRFIDAPYERSWFLDETHQVHDDWNRIREQIGKQHVVSNQVTSYEEYRDILFGNNRHLPTFRRFALTESNKYQNIPRTIQNIFLNTKLDADFIKETIIHSMSDQHAAIDLAYYRKQVEGFEREYQDVALWFQEEKNGKVKVREQANKVVEDLYELEHLDRDIEQDFLQLNTAIQHSQQEIPNKGVAILQQEERIRTLSAELSESQQNFQHQQKILTEKLGSIKSKLDDTQRRRAYYHRISIQEILERVGKESSLREEQRSVQAMADELTRAHADINTKYERILAKQQEQLRNLEYEQKERLLEIREEMSQRKVQYEQSQQRIRQEENQRHQAATELLKERINAQELERMQVKHQLQTLPSQEPHKKEKESCLRDIEALKKKAHAHALSVKDKDAAIERQRSAYERESERLQQEQEKALQQWDGKRAPLLQQIAHTEALLQQWEGTLYDWLEQHKPGWMDTIGKVIDEERVLYSPMLQPALTDGPETLFGVQVDLSVLPRRIRTTQELEEALSELQQQQQTLNEEQQQLLQNFQHKGEAVDKRHRAAIEQLNDELRALQAEQVQIAPQLKRAEGTLADLKAKEEAWREAERVRLTQEEKELAIEIVQLKEDLNDLQQAYREAIDALAQAQQQTFSTWTAEEQQATAHIQTQTTQKKLEVARRIETIKQQQQQELAGKGVDTHTLQQYEHQIAAIQQELTYIEQKRQEVFHYRRDKEELFDREDERKAKKEAQERELKTLETENQRKNTILQQDREHTRSKKLRYESEKKDLEDGLQDARNLYAEEALYPEGTLPTDKGCKQLVTQLRRNINARRKRTDDFKRNINQFKGNFSPNNTFFFEITLDGEQDYIRFAKNLSEFMLHDKISEYQKRIGERYAQIIQRVSKETGDLMRYESEIKKTIRDINEDFMARNFAGVIKEIALRSEPSSNKLIQLLLKMKAFNEEHQHEMGAMNLFASPARKDGTNREAVNLLHAFRSRLEDESQRMELAVSDTFQLQFRIKENDNDTEWVEKVSNVGSEGTDVLVKAMVNIMLINVFKEKMSRKAGGAQAFKLHCMMDEIGKLHPSNIKGILEFANCRNILLINSSPITHSVKGYRHTYLLRKDGQSQTEVISLLTNHENV